jgi:hypothetical protein
MRVGKVKLMCVAGAAGLWLGGVAEGSQVAITYELQNRSVSATSSVMGFARGGTEGTPVTDKDNHSQEAGDFDVFGGTATATSDLGPQSASANASASQNSTLGAGGFSASGTVMADSFLNVGGPASASAASVFHVTFDVSQAENYTFTASLNSSKDFEITNSDQVDIKLTDSGGNNGFSPITVISLSDFKLNGTLNPGTYVFSLDTSAASADQSNNFVNYNIALSADAQSIEAGPVSNAVPLPSAATASLTMLGGLGVVAMIKRRAAKWVEKCMI